MKRFALASVAALAIGSLALTACGNAEKEKAMQAQIDSCTKDKTAADAKVAELQAKVDQMTKDMEAAKATPTPSPEPTKGKPGAKATPTPKATATPAAATSPVPMASPHVKITPKANLKGPKAPGQ